MSFEGTPERELLQGDVVKALRDLGFDDPRARAIFDKWFSKKEGEADRKGTLAASIDVDIMRAEVYRDAGYIEAAIENFNTGAFQAEELARSLRAEEDRLSAQQAAQGDVSDIV